MPKRRLSAEQIVMLLRPIEMSMGQGNSTEIACREPDISEQLRDELLNGEVLLQPEGGADRHRTMAQALQHDQTALGA